MLSSISVDRADSVSRDVSSIVTDGTTKWRRTDLIGRFRPGRLQFISGAVHHGRMFPIMLPSVSAAEGAFCSFIVRLLC